MRVIIYKLFLMLKTFGVSGVTARQISNYLTKKESSFYRLFSQILLPNSNNEYLVTKTMKYVIILFAFLSHHRGETSLLSNRTKSYFWKSFTITIILSKLCIKSLLQQIPFECNQKLYRTERYLFF